MVHNEQNQHTVMIKEKDLTAGSIPKHLIRLTIPLIAGNILQQLYNTVDALIVGRYAGELEFAAIGVASSVMNMFLFAIVGACLGISVILAQMYGAKDMAAFRKEHFLAVAAGFGCSVIAGALGILLIPVLLSLLQTPQEVVYYAQKYLQIIMFSLPAAFLYNFYNGLFRAVGRVQVTLGILFGSVIMNVLLDFLFVAHYGWGIGGAAWATVAAQCCSVLCSLLYLRFGLPQLRFGRDDCHMDWTLLRKNAYYSLVTGLQQMGLYIGKLAVQGAVNTMGTSMIMAYTATTRIEGFANSFGDSGCSATSVLTAQNYGSGDRKRVREGFFTSLIILGIMGVLSAFILYFSASPITAWMLGKSSGEAYESAVNYLQIIAVFYIFCFVGNTFAGYFNGCGKVPYTMIGSIGHITLRAVLSVLLISRGGLSLVAVATGTGWVLVNLFWTVMWRRENVHAVKEEPVGEFAGEFFACGKIGRCIVK